VTRTVAILLAAPAVYELAAVCSKERLPTITQLARRNETIWDAAHLLQRVGRHFCGCHICQPRLTLINGGAA
jgi:hypothetical protein